MGKIKKYLPVKLIFGFIYQKESIYQRVLPFIKKHFGKIDFESSVMPFSYTDYYLKEFGTDLKRRFISIEKPVNPADLYKIKIYTNKLEEKLSQGQRRLINIDPGLLDLAKLILASTKDFSHRIWLNNGIFAELTLFFKDKDFQSLDWTYPDYRTEEYRYIFRQIRQIYAQQVKGLS
ncbi:MAG: DUF4416 family protein [Candidatus Omnitrophica bacterium]|jgi:hypothetical protein|nr:DUF4416 family protein [Candidatus Omnitrophota bacterium]